MTISLHDVPGSQPIRGYFPGHLTAGTEKEVAIGTAPFRSKVTAAYWIPSAAVTGDNTNYFSLTILNRGAAGAGNTVVATIDFITNEDAVAQTPVAITLSATAANLLLAEGDILTVEKSVTALGLACPDGAVVVTLKAR